MRTRSRSSDPLWAAFRPYPPSQGASADRAVLKSIKMYVPIQDAFSKLLHIKGGLCFDFRACDDVGYQHAKFQKYRTCDKKLRDICLSLLFLGHPVWRAATALWRLVHTCFTLEQLKTKYRTSHTRCTAVKKCPRRPDATFANEPRKCIGLQEAVGLPLSQINRNKSHHQNVNVQVFPTI